MTYPKRLILKHTGDSKLIYEAGKRTTKYPNEDDFQDYVNEHEGAESEANSLSQVDATDLISMIKPTVTEVSEAAEFVESPEIKEQLAALVWIDSEWLSKF